MATTFNMAMPVSMLSPTQTKTTITVAQPHEFQSQKLNTLLKLITSSTTLRQLKQVHAQILCSNLERSHSLLIRMLLSSAAFSSEYTVSLFSQIPNPPTHFSNQLLRNFSRGPTPYNALLLYYTLRTCVPLALDNFSFPPLLKAVSRASTLNQGLEIHGFAFKLGFNADPFIQTGLICMYAACGRVVDARLLFDKMSHWDVLAWNIMFDGYSQNGCYDRVLELYEVMKSSGVEPDGVIFCTVLSACGHAGNLSYGKAIHELIRKRDLVLDSHLQRALINMYANCGAMDLARKLYDELSTKHLVISTTMLSGYTKLGMVKEAHMIFDEMIEKDLVCWSAMISGYAESDQPHEALKLFDEMQLRRIVVRLNEYKI